MEVKKQIITFFENNAAQLHKNPCFPLFFWQPWKRGRNFVDNFSWANKTKNRKEGKWAKNREREKRKHYFSPDLLMSPKGRVNKRAGGGRFIHTARSTVLFLDPLLGVHFQRSSQRKRYYTTKIVGVSALFRVPTNERKSSNFKS